MTTTTETQQKKLGVVLLGASRFEHYRDLDNPAFAASAQEMRTALSSPDGSIFGSAIEVLNLFDEPAQPRDVLLRVRSFLREQRDLTDVLVGAGLLLRPRSLPA
jgi:hypothetical protein